VVFQEHAHFPWLTVERNIGNGPRVNGAAPEAIQRIFSESRKMIGLQRVGERHQGTLRRHEAARRHRARSPRSPRCSMDERSRRWMRRRAFPAGEPASGRRRARILAITLDEAILPRTIVK
jgi:hypothetical protein